MITPARIYVSVPNNGRLKPDELEIKRAIFERIRAAGFEPQELKVTGDLSEMPWSFENIQYKLGRCRGVVVLGLIRWDVWNAENQYKFVTAYNHFEGALALAKGLPTLILMHEEAQKSGIVLKGRAPYFVKLPAGADPSWLDTDPFAAKFNAWVEAVKGRHPIFLGYHSKAQVTAHKIMECLQEKGISVMDGVMNLDPTVTVADEIEHAATSCMGAVFLFTNDIEPGDANLSTQRDRMIFQAGYFLKDKGRDKILIVREMDVPIPSGLDRLQTVLLNDRDDISAIEKDLEEFITRNL